MTDADVHPGIELPERFRGHIEPSDDAMRFGEQHGARPSSAVNGRRGGDVARADVLGQCTRHEIAIRLGGEWFEGPRCHACGSDGGASSMKVSTGALTSLNVNSLT